jgi:hypothetical protein
MILNAILGIIAVVLVIVVVAIVHGTGEAD